MGSELLHRARVVGSPWKGVYCTHTESARHFERHWHDAYGIECRRWIGSLGRFGKLLLRAPFESRPHPLRAVNDPGDRLGVALEFVVAGNIPPVADRTYGLDEVPAAIRYLETGQAFGKIVITV